MKLIGSEARAKTLLSRAARLDRIMGETINSEAWPNNYKRWNRAYDARKKCEAKLGRIARHYLREVA